MLPSTLTIQDVLYTPYSTLTVSLKGKQCSSVEKLFLFIKDEKGNKLYHLTIYCTIIQ